MSVGRGLVPVGSVITLVIWWSAEGVDDARRRGLGGVGRPAATSRDHPKPTANDLLTTVGTVADH